MSASAVMLLVLPLAASGGNGDNWILGQGNNATETTSLSAVGDLPTLFLFGNGNEAVLRAGNNGDGSGSGIMGFTNGSSSEGSRGVIGIATNPSGEGAGGFFSAKGYGPGLTAHSAHGTAIVASADDGKVIMANGTVPDNASIFAGNHAAKTEGNMPVGIWGIAEDGTGLRGDGKYTGVLARSDFGFGLLGQSSGSLAGDGDWKGVGVLGVTENGTGVGGFSGHGVGIDASTGDGTALAVNGSAFFQSSGIGIIPAGQSTTRVEPGWHVQLKEGDRILVTLMGDPNGPRKKDAVWFSHVVPNYDSRWFDVVLTGPAGRDTPFAYFVITSSPY